jgi:hypothetical protein
MVKKSTLSLGIALVLAIGLAACTDIAAPTAVPLDGPRFDEVFVITDTTATVTTDDSNGGGETTTVNTDDDEGTTSVMGGGFTTGGG